MKIDSENIYYDFYLLFNQVKKSQSYSSYSRLNREISELSKTFTISSGMLITLPIIYTKYYENLKRKSDKRNDDLFLASIRNEKEYFLEYAHSYMDFLNSINFFSNRSYNGKYLYTNSEAIELLLEFFSGFGEFEYKVVKNILESGRVSNNNVVEIPDFKALCVGFKNIDPYILMNKRQFDLLEILSLAHELGHAIEFVKIKDMSNDFYAYDKFCSIEIASKFFELEFLRFLKNNRVNLFETNNLLNFFYALTYDFLSGYIDCFEQKEIVFENKLLKRIDGSFAISENKNIVRFFNAYDENLVLEEGEFTMEYPYQKSLRYGIGSLIALNLSEIKNNNPQEFNKLFHNFLCNRSFVPIHQNIKSFGYDLKEFYSCDLFKKQVEEDFTDFKRQYKIKL